MGRNGKERTRSKNKPSAKKDQGSVGGKHRRQIFRRRTVDEEGVGENVWGY